MKNLECFGTSKIGPKGQIVIPSELRKDLKIKNGDQFMVFKNNHINGIVILKTEDVTKLLKNITSEILEISEATAKIKKDNKQ